MLRVFGRGLTRWILLAVGLALSTGDMAGAGERWSKEEAIAWYARQPWLVGCNFAPSTASNQLEMWQSDTFDPETIDRELGWAEELGFNSVRVFLHNLLWDQDREEFLQRVDQFLAIADKHGIGTVLVPFDGVWDPYPKPGAQRQPVPHRHNSRWLQAPGAAILGDPKRHAELRPYVYGVIHHFRDDERIDAWDLFNEPDNGNPAYAKVELKNKAEMATMLLRDAFAWAREAEPTQPLTAGVWGGQWPSDERLKPIEKLSLDESDIISFHNYGPLADVKLRVEQLERYGRPILCTEYMARANGSRFDPILEYFKEQKVGAYNWGFVSGRSQTIYPWDSWVKKYDSEPELWFHDIFRTDGAPYDPAEVAYIKRTAGAE
ncbi:MAG: 1,4-beta-xylanase [Planctomycetota bacterium]|nr:MAG: 1,4-beta-xylanase [Planctomycetota bacterium]